MERLNRTGIRNRRIRLLSVLLLAGVTLAATGCGPKVIKGRPPLISISGMSLSGDRLTTVFDISNQNGIPMTINSTVIEVRVETTELTRYEARDKLLIDANSTEEVRESHGVDSFTRTVLASLDSGELKSLSFDLEGRVNTAEDGILRSELKGYLYPVPGKPGHFRAAVTQAKGLVRENPL